MLLLVLDLVALCLLTQVLVLLSRPIITSIVRVINSVLVRREEQKGCIRFFTRWIEPRVIQGLLDREPIGNILEKARDQA